MITFLGCLGLLMAAYFTYGRYLERLCGVDAARPVPSATSFDGVDYIPMPMWRTFLIQLLNIAGLGPIFGAVLGAAYGPVAFLWITFGGIFMGAAHDFIAGIVSLRSNGASLPETVGTYLGPGVKQLMRVFSVGLMVLVGAVFLSQPAQLIANRIDAPALSGIAFGGFSWLLLVILGVILIYYIVATLLPVDKIIGRIYPVFGCALLFMALGHAPKEKVVSRGGAQQNDLICISGNLGAAYMGLRLLEREKRVLADVKDPEPKFAGYEYLLEKYLKPRLRKDIVEALAEEGIVPTSMIDLSDGLSSDLMQICKASKCGARIYLDRIPIARQTYALAEEMNADPVVAALNGGEDHELLFTVPLALQEQVMRMGCVDVIGHITPESTGVYLVTPDGADIRLKAQGFPEKE